MKTFYKIIEDLLLIIIGISTVVGLFLVGCLGVIAFAGADALTNVVMIFCLVAAVLLTLILGKLYIEVRYRHLEIMADEYEQAKKLMEEGKLDEACELYEHLRVK
jgi:hypothetical protein